MENSIREKLHQMINEFSDERAKEVYDFIVDDDLPDELKAILDEEYNSYLLSGEVVSQSEVNEIIQTILYKNKK